MDLEKLYQNDLKTNEAMYMTQETMYAIRTRQEYGFEVVYAVYSRVIHAIAQSIVRNEHVARDISQDIFVTFWLKDTCYLTPNHVRRKLFNLVSTQSIDYVRQAKHNLVNRNLIIPHTPISTPIGDTDLYIKEVLTDIEYYSFVLAHLHGLTMREVSEILEIKQPTIASAYKRAVETLNEVYGCNISRACDRKNKEGEKNGNKGNVSAGEKVDERKR